MYILTIYICVYIYIYTHIYIFLSFPGGSDGKESACNAGDPGSIPRSGRGPGEGNSWRATVNGVRHDLVTNTFTFHTYIHECLCVWLSQSCPTLQTHGL